MLNVIKDLLILGVILFYHRPDQELAIKAHTYSVKIWRMEIKDKKPSDVVLSSSKTRGRA